MNTAVCTLFEGNYHYGVGALVNSLYRHGFRGTIWAGYRGKLPPWATPLETSQDYQEFVVAEGCRIRFIPLRTQHHFTNYKPDFMLQLWEDYCPNSEALFYFDPDIVIKCRWSYYEEWVNYGIALCEDVNSPIPNNHPLNMAWQSFYEPYGFTFDSSINIYVNGGFIGLTQQRSEFLQNWQKIQELMSSAIGDLKNANFKDRTFMFCKTDQDALNITLRASKLPTSLIGKEGMDFIYGGFTMSHAVGAPKPWQKQVISQVLLKGKSPSIADKLYWQHAQIPIQLYSQQQLFWKKLDLLGGTAMSRLLCR